MEEIKEMAKEVGAKYFREGKPIEHMCLSFKMSPPLKAAWERGWYEAAAESLKSTTSLANKEVLMTNEEIIQKANHAEIQLSEMEGEAWTRGEEDFANGKGKQESPFKCTFVLHKNWEDGWDNAYEESRENEDL